MQTINPMPTFTVLINGMPSGIISAVSYRQAVKRARAKYRRSVDVIGYIAKCEQVI